MTHEQKLEAVREKIIEAIPEIMELKFGCEIIASHRITKTCPDGEKKYVFVTEHPHQICVFSEGKFSVRHKKSFKIKKILGRLIRLSDVLYSISKNYGPDFFDKVISIVDLWNLKDDDLNNQRTETIDLLYNLLCK